MGTLGSASFSPETFLSREHPGLGLAAASDALRVSDFRKAIIAAFALSERDSYTYHAMASVNLSQVQAAIDAGAAHGLHAWYLDTHNEVLKNPSQGDIDAYIAIFMSGASAAASLTSFLSNAKKDSLRKDIAEYLISKRYLHPSLPDAKRKKKPTTPYPPNPAFDFWSWSCRCLEWAGPIAASAQVKTSHHILPVMMHHFGCVTPSEEAMSLLKYLVDSNKQSVVEVGSGNGYWTLMLRERGLGVAAVDNGQSVYRTMWISDTVHEDGVKWLKRNSGAIDRILLLVYPVTAGRLTADILRAYKGDVVCVVGTQSSSGYTAFHDQLIEDWMEREHSSFKRIAQIPLPSFPGKDEAMFVFQRGSQ